ncbi:MAG: prc1 [Bacteriovoracaceae bacterium]|nr:prc1 [Bacteriovoracaceae bacterium]
MKIRLFGSSLILILLMLVGSVQGFEKKTIGEYYKDVGLKYRSIQESLTNKSCYSSKLSFLGCVAAGNASLQFAATNPKIKKLFVLVAAKRLTPESGFGAVEKDFGILKVVEDKPALTGDLITRVRTKKMERSNNNDALIRAYEQILEPVMDFEALFAWIKKTIVDASDQESLITGMALNAAMEISVDPHSGFFPTQYDLDSFATNTEELSGIGAMLSEIDAEVVVRTPMEDGPAFLAGVKAKDIILEVNDKSVSGKTLDDVVQEIRGPEGTIVKLKIKRKEKFLTIDITRKKIQIRNVEPKILKTRNTLIGYVKLREFNHDSCEEMKAAVQTFSQAHSDSLILDLRDNPGGELAQSVCISGLFVGPGKTIVIEKELGNSPEQRIDKSTENKITDLPLIVLINPESASASEITSGSLQNLERAIIVGERSFGKGTVQAVRNASLFFPDLDKMNLHLTIERFFITPDRTTQIRGITPNLEVYKSPNPSAEDKFALREEDIFTTALPPVGVDYIETRPALMKKFSDCVDQSGVAKTQYTSRQDDAIPPDYQLLYAEDVAVCQLAASSGK